LYATARGAGAPNCHPGVRPLGGLAPDTPTATKSRRSRLALSATVEGFCPSRRHLAARVNSGTASEPPYAVHVMLSTTPAMYALPRADSPLPYRLRSSCPLKRYRRCPVAAATEPRSNPMTTPNARNRTTRHRPFPSQSPPASVRPHGCTPSAAASCCHAARWSTRASAARWPRPSCAPSAGPPPLGCCSAAWCSGSRAQAAV